MYRGNGKTADDTAESAAAGKNRKVRSYINPYIII